MTEDVTRAANESSTETAEPRSRRTALYLCMFASGCAGLIYEVLWAKYLALFVGSSGRAQVIVLATYMAGLALGGQIVGRWADRVRNPLRFYAALELGIGLCALFFRDTFELSRFAFLHTARTTGLSGPGLAAAQTLASVLCMLLPTFLMGGTLPAMARYMIRGLGAVGNRVSMLYFINSLGAVLGCLLAGFWLIQSFGLHTAMLTGASLNVACAIGAFGLSFFARPGTTTAALPAESVAQQPASRPRAFPLVLLCVALSGAVAMAYEVAWIRLLSLVLGASTYAFSLMLATFILGLSLGSLLLSRRRKTTGYDLIFGAASVGVGIAVLVSLPFYLRLPYAFNALASSIARDSVTFPYYQAVMFLMCALVMIGPTLLQGVTLPAATQMLAQDMPTLGRRIGFVFAVNTLGTLAGAVLAGYVALPAIGIKGTLNIAVAVNIAVGIAILFVARRDGAARWAPDIAAGVAVVAVMVYGAVMPDWDKRFLEAGLFRTRQRVASPAAFATRATRHRLAYYRDGVDATISVRSSGRPPNDERALVVNGKIDATTLADMATQKAVGHLPLLIAKNPRRVLVVGLGSGSTVGALIAHPGVETVDVVEISGEVIEAARLFEKVNGRYWDDPRVRIHHEDAKTFLQLNDQRYDVIVSEPSNPWVAGVAGVFSTEYFQLCREHLADDGIMCQWIQTYEMDDATCFMVLETLTGVFPFYAIWNPTSNDIVVTAATGAKHPDFALMRERMAAPSVRADLTPLHIESPLPFLAMQMCAHLDRPSHVAWTGTTHSDYFPVLEYKAARGFFAGSVAGGVGRLLDWRPRAPAFTRLWIQDYMVEFPPDDAAFAECTRFLVDNRPRAGALPLCWASEWTSRFPSNPSAWTAYAAVVTPSYQRGIEDLAAAQTGAATNPVAAKREFMLRMADYRAQRTYFVTNQPSVLLYHCRRLTERAAAQTDADILYAAAELHFDAGELGAAEDALRDAIAAFEERQPREDALDARILLCRVLLAAGRREAAREAFLRYLAPLRRIGLDAVFTGAAIEADLRGY